MKKCGCCGNEASVGDGMSPNGEEGCGPAPSLPGASRVPFGAPTCEGGHPFRWTSDDVDHARQLANTISRPWGAGGPSPQQALQQRTPITDQDRQAFAAALRQQRQWAAGELALDLSAELSVADRAARPAGDLQRAPGPGLPHAAAQRPSGETEASVARKAGPSRGPVPRRVARFGVAGRRKLNATAITRACAVERQRFGPEPASGGGAK